MKLAKSLDRLGTETAFSVLAEAKKLEAKGKPMIHPVSYTHLTLPTHREE